MYLYNVVLTARVYYTHTRRCDKKQTVRRRGGYASYSNRLRDPFGLIVAIEITYTESDQ